MELKLPRPSPKQLQFILDEVHKNQAFGGSRGGGKSFAVRLKAIILAYKYPGITALIVRKTYPELDANHIQPLIKLLHCHDEDRNKRFAEYNDSKKRMVFPNGSVILFRYLDTDRDAHRFQGLETDCLYVDEATQQSEDNIKKLTACVRGVNKFPKLIHYTCNPGGVGHTWMKRLFIDRRYNEGENPEDYSFIQSSVFDNAALLKTNADYVKQLEALPPRLRDMWLYGSWDIFTGMYYENFRTEPDLQAAHEAGCDDDIETLRRDGRWCHVIEPFDMNSGNRRNWTIIRGFDFGYHRPSACSYFAIDYDGVMYNILEIYFCTGEPNEGTKMSPQQQFEYIAKFENQHPWLKGKNIQGVADPAIWDASRGESIAETATKYGIYFTKGDHERLAGLMQTQYRLQFDSSGRARFYVFNNCTEFIRTIPTLLYSENKPEDIDTLGEDHIADEWRYVCMSRPIKPLHQVERKTYYSDPLNQIKKGATQIWTK